MKKLIILCASLLASTCYAPKIPSWLRTEKEFENEDKRDLHDEAFAHVYALQAKQIEQQVNALLKPAFHDESEVAKVVGNFSIPDNTRCKIVILWNTIGLMNGDIQKEAYAQHIMGLYNEIQYKKSSLGQLEQEMIDKLFISKDASS